MLLGANGAGKTSLLEAISGVIRAASGTISLAGTDITRMSRTNRSRGGVAHVEQGRSIFSDLTTEENLLVAGPKSKLDASYELFPQLVNRRHALSGLLSGGDA